MLGKIVTVTVDRPLGSYHSKHHNIFYTVNYGYVKGILAGDGAYQDAYILGVNEPVKEFTGKVIAIIRRSDDVEDKLIVAPPDLVLTKDEIYEQVKFQEQFFNTYIEM